MRDARQVVEGVGALPGGMNSGVSPELVRPDQVSFAINVSFRDAYAQSRPQFRRIALDFDSEEERDYFKEHHAQAMLRYDPPNASPVIAAMVGGRLYSIAPSATDPRATVINATPENDPNSSIQDQMWMVQAAQYLIVQDGLNKPIIYDGSTARRAVTGVATADGSGWEVRPEVPVGRQMAYGNWRLFVTLPDKRQIRAGDFSYVTETSVLEFTEEQYLEGGGTLSIPTEGGDIRALLFMAQSDSTSGQGALLAATPTSIIAFNPVPLRSQWEQIEFSKIAVLNRGFLSQGGTTLVNGDVWGRAIDGLRSYAMTQRQTRTWAHAPMSREMNRIFTMDTENLLEYSSAAYFDNRLLMTCSPYLHSAKSGAVVHRGIVALSFENLASVGEASPPAYEGLWTGIQPYHIISGLFDGTERCFSLAESESGELELWEITKTFGNDNDTCRVESVIESRLMNFPSRLAPIYWPKRLSSADLWYDKLQGTVDFEILYRPDQYPCWLDWDSWTEDAPVGVCDSDFASCLVPNMGWPQYRTHVSTQSVPATCDPISKRPYNHGYAFQFRLKWTGPARIKQVILKATQLDEPPVAC